MLHTTLRCPVKHKSGMSICEILVCSLKYEVSCRSGIEGLNVKKAIVADFPGLRITGSLNLT